MRTIFHYILICLFLSDNLYLVCTLLSAIHFDFGVKGLVWTMPYFVFPFKDISRTACLLTTIILSYERYSICCDPKKFRRSNSISSEKKNKCKLMLVMTSVWTFSIVYNILRFWAYTLKTGSGAIELKKTRLREDPDYKLYYKGVRWVIFTIVSLGMLIFLNWKIYKYVSQSLKGCEKTSPGTEKEGVVSGDTMFPGIRNSRMHKQLFKIIRKRENLVFALFALVICNLICNSLKMIEEIIQGLGYRPDGLGTLKDIARLMVTMNSSVNSLIYCFSDKQFRVYLDGILVNLLHLISCNYLSKDLIKNKKRNSDRSSSQTNEVRKSTNIESTNPMTNQE